VSVQDCVQLGSPFLFKDAIKNNQAFPIFTHDNGI
jgi:hypothetical protein